MATNNQFTISVHIMTALAYRPDFTCTSAILATSVNANASFVRRILSQLSKAGLVHTSTGKSGACTLAKAARDITLLDIYHAVEPPQAIAMHSYPEQEVCLVSCKIKGSLDGILTKAQLALEDSLQKSSLANVLAEIKK